MELVAQSSSNDSKTSKLLHCMEWLEKQNSDVLQNRLDHGKENDIKYIIQTNADRNKCLLSVGGDEATVPAGADEPSIKPVQVPLHRLRLDNLRMACEWLNCSFNTYRYEVFGEHVRSHLSDVHTIETNSGFEYKCLWDVCGHKTSDSNEMIRHINFHAYHARLLAIGLNGRTTLKLARCKRDSSKRNHIPNLPNEYACMWVGCDETFNSIQFFLHHVNQHIGYTKVHLCSWAGCGTKYTKRVYLRCHLRSHTNEKLIACYHCGMHFASNRKLADHLRRQNVAPDSPYECSMCGVKCATEYLLSEHTRQHVSTCVCSLCDMTAPTPAALATHVRYRHLSPAGSRVHACTQCEYRAVTKFDLRKHMTTHDKKRKVNSDEDNDENNGSNADGGRKVKKEERKYACHLCPEKRMKIFSRGSILTKHLVKVHGAQWPFGHCRFRYQISEDGMYRLTTTRYEMLEVSKKIVDRHRGPKEFLNDKSEFVLEQISEPTDKTPRRFGITFKTTEPDDTKKAQDPEVVQDPEEAQDSEEAQDPEGVEDNEDVKVIKPEGIRPVEILMCDVDEHGKIIRSEVIYS